jgi:hypothetical protein
MMTVLCMHHHLRCLEVADDLLQNEIMAHSVCVCVCMCARVCACVCWSFYVSILSMKYRMVRQLMD